MNVEKLMAALQAKHPGEQEYLQAVHEVLLSIEEVYAQHPEFEKAKIIERMVEPDRILTFRVAWVDDYGEVQTNFSKNRQKDFSTNEKYGEAVKKAAEHIEHNEKKRMSPYIVANKILTLVKKRKMKPYIIVSGKYKLLSFFTRFVPQSLILKGSNKILGGKK